MSEKSLLCLNIVSMMNSKKKGDSFEKSISGYTHDGSLILNVTTKQDAKGKKVSLTFSVLL